MTGQGRGPEPAPAVSKARGCPHAGAHTSPPQRPPRMKAAPAGGPRPQGLDRADTPRLLSGPDHSQWGNQGPPSLPQTPAARPQPQQVAGPEGHLCGETVPHCPHLEPSKALHTPQLGAIWKVRRGTGRAEQVTRLGASAGPQAGQRVGVRPAGRGGTAGAAPRPGAASAVGSHVPPPHPGLRRPERSPGSEQELPSRPLIPGGLGDAHLLPTRLQATSPSKQDGGPVTGGAAGCQTNKLPSGRERGGRRWGQPGVERWPAPWCTWPVGSCRWEATEHGTGEGALGTHRPCGDTYGMGERTRE